MCTHRLYALCTSTWPTGPRVPAGLPHLPIIAFFLFIFYRLKVSQVGTAAAAGLRWPPLASAVTFD